MFSLRFHCQNPGPQLGVREPVSVRQSDMTSPECGAMRPKHQVQSEWKVWLRPGEIPWTMVCLSGLFNVVVIASSLYE